MQDFRNLAVWQKAHQLALEIYRATRLFPKDELYGMTSQMRRAAVSVSANLAEGCGRRTDADFARFTTIAMGSASELDCLILLSRDLNLMDGRVADALAAATIEVKRMLASLTKRLAAGS